MALFSILILLVFRFLIVSSSPTTYKYDTEDPEDFKEFERKYGLLRIASRIEFNISPEQSFAVLEENNYELDTFFRTSDINIRNELIEIARIRNMISTDPRHSDRIERAIESFVDSYVRDLINNRTYWPYYVYNPFDNTIYLRNFQRCAQYILRDNRRTDVFPRIFPTNREDREMTQRIFRLRQRNRNVTYRFNVDTTPDTIIHELQDSMARHHIIPVSTLVPFIDRFHAMLNLINEVFNETSPVMSGVSNLEYLNNLRYRIGELLNNGEPVESIRRSYYGNEFNVYDKRLLTWAPGNIFWGPKNRDDDPDRGFEIGSRIVIPQYYDTFLELYNNMTRINNRVNDMFGIDINTRLSQNQAALLLYGQGVNRTNNTQAVETNYEEYSETDDESNSDTDSETDSHIDNDSDTGIFRRMRRIISKIRLLFARTANLKDMVYGIKFDINQWIKKSNGKWVLKTDYTDLKNEFIFLKRDKDDDDDDKGGWYCSAATVCPSPSRIKRSVACKIDNYIDMIVNEPDLMCEYDKYHTDLISYSQFLKRKIRNKHPYVQRVICNTISTKDFKNETVPIKNPSLCRIKTVVPATAVSTGAGCLAGIAFGGPIGCGIGAVVGGATGILAGKQLSASFCT